MAAEVIRLNTNWIDHPAIMDVGIDGAGLHAMALCLALNSDGTVPRSRLLGAGAPPELIDRLCAAGLLNGDGERLAVDLCGSYAVRPKHWTWRERAKVTPAIRRSILERDGHRCQRCGSTDPLEIDHKLPLARGGTSDPSNLQVLCRPCNRRKWAHVEDN